MNFFGVYHSDYSRSGSGIFDAPCITVGRMMLCAHGAVSRGRLLALAWGRARNASALAEALGCGEDAPAALLALRAYERWGADYPAHLEGPVVSCVMDAEKEGEPGVLKMSPEIIEPIQELKTEYLGNNNPRLHMDEILIALTICAQSDPIAMAAVQVLHDLSGCEAHSTVILSSVDDGVFRKLGMNLTCEPNYNSKKLYHKKS